MSVLFTHTLSYAASAGLGALGGAQGIRGYRAHGQRPAIALDEPLLSLSALQRAGDLAGQVQPCASSMRRIDVPGQALANLVRFVAKGCDPSSASGTC